MLCRIERRPPKLDLDIYPYLPRANVATTAAAAYDVRIIFGDPSEIPQRIDACSWVSVHRLGKGPGQVRVIVRGSSHDPIGRRQVRQTEAVVASCGMPSASRMLPSVSGPRLSQHSCMLRVRRCRVLTDGVMAPVFAKNAAAYGCSTARNKGTCNNLKTIRRDELEAKVLDGLKGQLMRPEPGPGVEPYPG